MAVAADSTIDDIFVRLDLVYRSWSGTSPGCPQCNRPLTAHVALENIHTVHYACWSCGWSCDTRLPDLDRYDVTSSVLLADVLFFRRHWRT